MVINKTIGIMTQTILIKTMQGTQAPPKKNPAEVHPKKNLKPEEDTEKTEEKDSTEPLLSINLCWA
tara:strand:+ start:16 stop:213 length:198 start_codon:yes stop_codon:yes gene_type:complete